MHKLVWQIFHNYMINCHSKELHKYLIILTGEMSGCARVWILISLLTCRVGIYLCPNVLSTGQSSDFLSPPLNFFGGVQAHWQLQSYIFIFINIWFAIRRLNKYILYAKGLSKGTQATKLPNEMKMYKNEKMAWNTQDTNLSSYVPKANMDHTISCQGTGISTLDHSATTPRAETMMADICALH